MSQAVSSALSDTDIWYLMFPPGGDGLWWLRPRPGEAGGHHADALHRARSAQTYFFLYIILAPTGAQGVVIF